MARNRSISDKSGRTHDDEGKPYGRWEKRFNDAEETTAEVLFGKCSLLCGSPECSRGCINR